MDTGTHIVCNLIVQGRTKLPQPQLFTMVIVGAILPDAPMILFYVWESLVQQTPESVIWSERYYLPAWQNFFDIFNSIPIAVAGLIMAIKLQKPILQIIFVGVLLHIAFDFPLHNDDAHRHFYPLSDWRFISPFSYWDSNHYGHIIMPLQILFAVLGLIWLWMKHRSRYERVVVGGISAIYVSFMVYAAIVW